jgi:SAM-dependent methyltransferase
LEGDARYKWSHSIAARLNDKVDGKLLPRGRRVSLTFRHALVPGELPAVSIRPSHVETDHVFRVYDNIAVHWNHTRGKRKVHWHRVKKFLESLPKGSLMADIGSGDGKYFGLNPGVISVGCDRSLNLLKVSREPGHETFCCDAVKLPLQSDAFDATICVAVLHHLASKDRRVAAVRELLRITRPGGRVLVQAWAMEQGEESRHAFEDQDVLVPWRLQQRFLQPGQTESSPATTSLEGPCEHVEEQGDGQLLFQRYCHVYKQGELEEICSYVPGCRIVDSCWDKGNWVVEVVKIVDERLKGCNTAEEAALPAFIKRH